MDSTVNNDQTWPLNELPRLDKFADKVVTIPNEIQAQIDKNMHGF